MVAISAWTDEDSRELDQAERALDRLRYAHARDADHAATLKQQREANERAIARMRARRDGAS